MNSITVELLSTSQLSLSLSLSQLSIEVLHCTEEPLNDEDEDGDEYYDDDEQEEEEFEDEDGDSVPYVGFVKSLIFLCVLLLIENGQFWCGMCDFFHVFEGR